MTGYRILPLRAELPALTGKVFHPDDEPFCLAHDCARISHYDWDETGYRPEARAYIAWDAQGIHVLMCACEKTIVAKETKFGGAVCFDSCVEFFLQPFQDDPRYVNIEVNAAGVAHIGLGAGRHDRIVLDKMPENMNFRTSKHEGAWWAAAYTIPNALLERLFGRVPQAGSVMRANLYKCDETIHPHFGSWSPIVYDSPDFHRPESFGEMLLVRA